MRVLTVVTLLSAGLLASGCSGKTTSTSTTTPVTAPSGSGVHSANGTLSPTISTPSIALDACANFGGVFPVPAAAAQAILPDGFKAVLAANDPQGGAALYVLILKCGSAHIDNASVDAPYLAYAELAVTPDAGHQVTGISDYTVPVFFQAHPAALAAAFAGLHLGKVQNASILWGSSAPGTQDASVTSDAGGFSLSGVLFPEPPAGLASGSFVVFAVQDRQIVAAIDGASVGGQSVHAAVKLDVQGSPMLVGQAQPVANGFSVNTFALTYKARGA